MFAVRIARAICVAALALESAIAAPPAGAAAGSSAAARPIRLLLPFPLTGPRDIQGIERATRAYRAISPHAPQPLSEALADVVVMAAAPEFEVARVRRPSTDNDLDPARIEAAHGGQPGMVLLSQESIARSGPAGAPGEGANSGSSPPPQWVAPLAIMPLALLVSPRAAPALGAAQTRWTVAGRPARLGSAGERSASHLAGLLFAQAPERRHLLHVPYNGGHAAVNALFAAEIDVGFVALPLAMPYIASGKLPVLGLASKQRFVLLPQLPTLAEVGVDVVWEGWFALSAGRRLPPAARERLRARVQATIGSPSVRSALLLRGLEPADADVARFAERVDAERARARAVRATLEH